MNNSKMLFLAGIASLFVVIPVLSAQDRGIGIAAKELGGQYAKIGKQYAVFIAVDKYKNWTALKNPVKDAKEIRDILKARYFIDEISELYDESATKAGVFKLFSSLVMETKPEDSVFIYYAGHGQLDTMTDTGFWIPIDAGTDQFNQENWIPNIQIRNLIGKMGARHVALISDSCFSGDILNPNRSASPEINQEYFKNAYSRIARQVLTSGASETVPDKSEFSNQLKLALKGNNNPYLDPFMLYSEIRTGMIQTTPLFGDLKDSGHQTGGSFLFFLKNDSFSEKKPEQELKTDLVPVTPSTGNIVVNTFRSGTVFIDGVEKGRIKADGNRTFPSIENGRTEVKIVYEDATSEALSVRVESGVTANAVFKTPEPPMKKFGSLRVEVKAEGTLYLQGSYKGTMIPGETLRIQDLETGDVLLLVRYADGETEKKQATVEGDKDVSVLFSHVERPTPFENMIQVKGGTFKMGSKDGVSNEQPLHDVRVSNFMIGKCEVTQKEWFEIMGYNPSNFKGNNLPVEQISWYEAVEYCNKKSVKEGLNSCYSISGTKVSCDFTKNGYRLPTEAEWEFAARGAVSSKGFKYSGSDDLSAVAWYSSNSGNTTQPIGTKAANELGLFDLSGNVWEWCWDWFGNYTIWSQTDPRGASSGDSRIIRGGSWSGSGSGARPAYRKYYIPGSADYSLGFRLACSQLGL